MSIGRRAGLVELLVVACLCLAVYVAHETWLELSEDVPLLDCTLVLKDAVLKETSSISAQGLRITRFDHQDYTCLQVEDNHGRTVATACIPVPSQISGHCTAVEKEK